MNQEAARSIPCEGTCLCCELDPLGMGRQLIDVPISPSLSFPPSQINKNIFLNKRPVFRILPVLVNMVYSVPHTLQILNKYAILHSWNEVNTSWRPIMCNILHEVIFTYISPRFFIFFIDMES